MYKPKLSILDTIIIEIDHLILNTCFDPQSTAPHPDDKMSDYVMSEQDTKHAVSLMRVNHCGEICAQGLYRGQMLLASDEIYDKLQHAANEECNHLAWTSRRINQLHGKTSRLNILFYSGSLIIGILSAACGDRYSMGFIAETECQVGKHLKSHLAKLPSCDKKSIAILSQMLEDEQRHENMAHAAGAASLPFLLQKMMHFLSRIMVKTTYYY